MGRWLGIAAVALVMMAVVAVSPDASAEASTLEEIDEGFAAIEAARAHAANANASQAEERAQSAQEAFEHAVTQNGHNDAPAVLEAVDGFVNETGKENATTASIVTAAVGVEAQALDLLVADDATNYSTRSGPGPNETLAWLADRADPRTVPAPANGTVGMVEGVHSRRAAIDALLAARVLEEVAAAEVLALQGTPGAHDHADRAKLLWDALGPRLSAALEQDVARGLDEGIGNLSTRLDDVQAGQGDLVEITGPLTAVTYHRSIDRLTGIVASIEGPLFLALRTMDTEPDRSERLLEDTEQHYRNHRVNFLRHGDRGTLPTDRAFETVLRTLGNGTTEELATAIEDAVTEMHESAKVGYGLRFTVRDTEWDGASTEQIPVGLTNTGLEGIEGYRVALRFNSSNVNVTDVEMVWAERNASVERAEGKVVLAADGPKAFGGTHLATLSVQPRADTADAAIRVSEHTFDTPEGAEAIVAEVEGAELSFGGSGPSSGEEDQDHDHGVGGDHHGDAVEGSAQENGDGGGIASIPSRSLALIALAATAWITRGSHRDLH
jgi:hypothetical protein